MVERSLFTEMKINSLLAGQYYEMVIRFQLLIVDIRNVTERGRKNVQYYDKKAVGARIKQMRNEKKITQSKLAESLDYTTERQLQRIENGETGCSVDKLMEIAQILNTSTDYLLFGVDVANDNVWGSMISGKSEGQIRFMRIIMKAMVDNIELV